MFIVSGVHCKRVLKINAEAHNYIRVHVEYTAHSLSARRRCRGDYFRDHGKRTEFTELAF